MENHNIKTVKSGNWLVEDFKRFDSHYEKNRERWEKAFSWLMNTDLATITPGKYVIDDDKIFASVSEYMPKDETDVRFEAHKKYIDIQHVVKGEECIGVAPLSKAKAVTEFDEQKDIGFFEIPEEDCKYYDTGQGRFFVFFPEDVHKPGIKTAGGGEVKKVVVKVMV